MYVIAYAGTVFGRVVVAKNLNGLATENGVEYQRNEVGFGVVGFTDLAFGITAGGVEVAQCRVGEGVRDAVPVQRALDNELGLAVRIYAVVVACLP